MSATFVPRSWPPFGRALPSSDGRDAGFDVTARQWLLRPNCSITPRQMGLFYLSLCAVSVLIGAYFYSHGAPFVAVFAGLELLAVGAALLFFARHAGDRELLTLQGRALVVEQTVGPAVHTTRLPIDWLTVEPVAGQRSLLEIHSRGQRVRVGRFVRPDLRAALAQELRAALRRAQDVQRPENDLN